MANVRKRVDPRSTRADGMRPFHEIVNGDPTKKYVWANPNEEERGVPFMLGEGWELVPRSEDGPRSAVPGMKTDGDYVAGPKGYVLMQMDIELYEGIQAAHRAKADAFDAAVIKRRNGIPDDPMRGIRNGISFRNDITDNFIERGV